VVLLSESGDIKLVMIILVGLVLVTQTQAETRTQAETQTQAHAKTRIKTMGKGKPDIVFILADDLGVNDVGWNNPSSPTPHLNTLARDGVILDSAYTLPVCSPSRAALLTGVYPYKFGFQRGFGPNLPEGLPLDLPLLPELLKGQGYSTHGMGKWHLGFCSDSYTPVRRGFDTFDGLYVGDEDDMDEEELSEEAARHLRVDQRQFDRKLKRLDLFSPNNKKKKQKKKLKQPLRNPKTGNFYNQTLQEEFDSLAYAAKAVKLIQKADEKPLFLYLALLTKVYPDATSKKKDIPMKRLQKVWEMDQAVEQVVEALKSAGRYDNSIIVFISDNGARYIDGAEEEANPNYPLKGFKNTIYEGGSLVPGFVHSPLVKGGGRRHKELLHMVDFLPTLVTLAGGTTSSPVDGLDQWASLSLGLPSPRATVIYNIDDMFVPSLLAGPVLYQKFQIGLRGRRYKLVWGQSSMLHRNYRKPQYSKAGVTTEFQGLELYDLQEDPGETRNLATRRRALTQKLQRLALELYKGIVPPRFTVSQSTRQVLDRGSPGRGVTGWCRAALSTSCTSLHKDTVDYRVNSSLVQLHFGTLDSGARPLLCTTLLAD